MTKAELLRLIHHGRFYHSVMFGGRQWLACNACHKIVALHGHNSDCVRGKFEREQNAALRQSARCSAPRGDA